MPSSPQSQHLISFLFLVFKTTHLIGGRNIWFIIFHGIRLRKQICVKHNEIIFYFNQNCLYEHHHWVVEVMIQNGVVTHGLGTRALTSTKQKENKKPSTSWWNIRSSEHHHVKATHCRSSIGFLVFTLCKTKNKNMTMMTRRKKKKKKTRAPSHKNRWCILYQAGSTWKQCWGKILHSNKRYANH